MNASAGFGQFVDIGGRRLFVRSSDKAGPCVLFENGAGSSSAVWLRVEEMLRDDFRTIAYDRAGLGLSDPAKHARSGDAVVDDLVALLDELGVQTTIVVAHSAGGLYAQLLRARVPSRVAGIVFVDAVDGYTYDEVTRALRWWERSAQKVLGLLTRAADAVGLASVVVRRSPGPLVASNPAALAAHRQIWTGRNRMMGSRAEGAELPAIAEGVRVLPGLDDLPIVVVIAGERRGAFKRIAAQWQATQARLAALSTCSEIVVADGATHFVQLDRPDVIADAVRTVESRVQ